MDIPKPNYRYLITFDNSATVRLMRFKFNGDGTPMLLGGAYMLQMGEPKHYNNIDNVTVDVHGYQMAMSPEAWTDNLFEHEFKVLKVFEVPPLTIRLETE